MKRGYLLALPVIMILGCAQEPDSTKKLVFGGVSEEAMIKLGVESLQLKSFYVPTFDVAHQGITTEESMAAFSRKNKLSEEKMLAAVSSQSGRKQYQSFIEENASDPNIDTFRRQTAEKFLDKQSLAVSDKAYFTSELIAGRSSNVDLIRSSIIDLGGKVSLVRNG